MSSTNVSFYCAAFDKDGKRIASTICNYDPSDSKNADKITKLQDDLKTLLKDTVPAVVEIITAADYDLYAQKGYVRDEQTGKPIPYIPPEPTVAEKTLSAANTLKNEYTPQIAALKDALATATLAGDTETIEDLKSEYADVTAEYNQKLEALNND